MPPIRRTDTHVTWVDQLKVVASERRLEALLASDEVGSALTLIRELEWTLESPDGFPFQLVEVEPHDG